jgi:hypothetical protein
MHVQTLLHVQTVLQVHVPTWLQVHVRLSELDPELESGLGSGSSHGSHDGSNVSAAAAVIPAPKNPRRFILAFTASVNGTICAGSFVPSE